MLRSSLVVWILGTLIFSSAAPLLAGPPARDCSGGNAAILAPLSGGALSGIVQIEGTASLGGEFLYYKLEVAPTGTEAWGDLVGEAREQVVNGQLGVWDSASAVDGEYTLRLRVVDPTGNYCEAFVTNLRVQNSSPPTPTIEATPIPVETEAPPILNVVPTPLPTVPSSDETGTPGPSPTAERAGPTRTPVPGSGGIGGIELGEVMDAAGNLMAAVFRIFMFGMLTMGAVLVLVGVVYFVRRVL
jgi:hypothetical protein